MANGSMANGSMATLEDELHAELTLEPGVEEIFHPVARVVRVRAFLGGQNQRVVVVARGQVHFREVDDSSANSVDLLLIKNLNLCPLKEPPVFVIQKQ